MPDVWVLASATVKLSLYLGVLLGAGTVFAACAFGFDRFRAFAAVWAGIGLLATFLGFALQAGQLLGEVSGMVDPDMLALLWASPVGIAFVLRIAGLGLVLAGSASGRLGLWLAVGGGFLALCSFAVVGHVAGADRLVLKGVLMLHLLAIALWIGILAPLRRLAAGPETMPQAARVGHQFGVVATFTIPLLVIAGGYLAYVLTGSLSALTGTGYGRALLMKVALVAMLLGLGAFNKLRLVPALRAGSLDAAVQLRRVIMWEWVVMILVLGVTAVLTSALTLPTL